MDPIVEVTNAASLGFQRLFDYGAAVTVLVLALVACGFLVRYLLNRCDARFSESLASHKELTAQVTDVVEKNTIAFTQVAERLKDLR